MRRLMTVNVGLLLALGAAAAQAAPAPARLVTQEAPSSTVTGTVDLGKEFPQMSGFTLGQSFSTVAPGTGRALHSHAGAPELVRIISGTLTDARNGGPPIAYGPGSTLVNAGGTEHMWANLGTEPVVFVSVSLRPTPPAR